MAWPTWPDDIVTDELVTAAWLTNVSQSFAFIEEVNYTAFPADVAATATTVATANQIVSSGPITYEAVPHMIEFYCPHISNGAGGAAFIIIRDSTTVLGTLARLTASTDLPALLSYRVTPTAASHTYNVACWRGGAGTTTFNAGTGGTAGDSTTDVAGYIRIRRIPT